MGWLSGGTQACSLPRFDHMSIELLLDFEEFWSRLREDIARAQKSVYIQTFAFEGDSVGKQLAEALLSSEARDKRVLADSFTRIVLSDRFRYSPSNILDSDLRREARETVAILSALKSAGIGVSFTNPYRPTPRKLLSRNHKKLIVIDDSAAYIGGINFSEHNAAWHDMMLRFSDTDAVAFLHEDFLSTWNGNDRVAHRKFNELELYTLDGRNNRQAFQRVFNLIDSARETVFVESPYITFPFYERLREAAARGMNVKIVTPQQNNWGFFRDYARLESARSRIDLRFFADRMSHLKAMLIDDKHLIAGSSNFDYLSYRIHQETIAVITDQSLVTDFRERVMIPDLANAKSVECHASLMGQRWLNWQTKLIDAAVTALT